MARKKIRLHTCPGTPRGAGEASTSDSARPLQVPAAPSLSQPQRRALARQQIIERHLMPCTRCKMATRECTCAEPGASQLKCMTCIIKTRVKPECEHKEWLKASRVTEWAILTQNGTSMAVADCIVFGHLTVFGHPEHDRVRDYSEASVAIRQQYCRPDFWDGLLPVVARASLPRAESVASEEVRLPSRHAEAPRLRSTGSSSLTSLPRNSPQLENEGSSTVDSHQREHIDNQRGTINNDQQEQIDDQRSAVNNDQRQNTDGQRGSIAPSPRSPRASRSPRAPPRTPSPDPEPEERVYKRRRSSSVSLLSPPPLALNPHSYFPHLPLSDAHYARQSHQAYKDFFTHYAAHHTARTREAREAALTVVVESFLNRMHWINGGEEGGFTGVFGVGLGRRR